jgi:tetratricopeptide (TPR) repeat protein
MKQLIVAAILCLSAGLAAAQEQDWKALQETAKTFTRQGDYPNAIMVLNRAIENDNNNLELKKDLAFAYYLNRDYVRAMETAKPFPERADADVQSFQILGMVYKAIEEAKDAEKMYRIALKKFPNSGVLYSEYGEMLWSKKSYKEAIAQWEKGIEVDPNHSGNYYNASKYYFFTKDKVWALLYGEIFLNLESYSKRTPEIKTILLDSYKKLFTDGDITKGQDNKNDLAKAFLDVMGTQSAYVASNGVTPETLSAIRTKFVISWFTKYAKGLPFRLFEYQQQLLKGGMFEAYNQWVFGTAGNLPAYESWTKTHAEEYSQFNTFQHSRVFKLPATGQYYQTANK